MAPLEGASMVLCDRAHELNLLSISNRFLRCEPAGRTDFSGGQLITVVRAEHQHVPAQYNHRMA